MAHGLNSIHIKREIEISNDNINCKTKPNNHHHHHNLLHNSQHYYLEQQQSQHMGIMMASNINTSTTAAATSSSSSSSLSSTAPTQQQQQQQQQHQHHHHHPTTATKMGSRRIFTPLFKLQVLDSYRNDNDCKGNQRATARKYGIHRRQIQKWLQCEPNLRTSVTNGINGRSSSNKLNSSTATSAIKNSPNEQHQLAHQDKPIDVVNGMPFDLTPTCNRQPQSACYEPTVNVGTPLAQSPLTSSSSSPPPPPPPAVAVVFPTAHHQNSYNYSPYNLVAPSYPSTEEIYQQQQFFNSTAAAAYYENYYILPPHLGSGHSPAFSSVPIDLSLHTRGRTQQRCESITSPSSPVQVYQLPTTIKAVDNNSTPSSSYVADIWDLSASSSRKRKPADADATAPETPAPKVARLFRPFLDDDNDDDDDDDGEENETVNKVEKFTKHADPIIWSNYTTSVGSPPYTMDLNNNLAYTSLASPGYETMQSYAATVIIAPPQQAPSSSTKYSHFISYGSPVSGYDTASSYSSSSECGDSIPPRNCNSADSGYSVDFKIQAIDSYYNECRGNKEAVADKFSVHRRQIQRWLLQEDDLRRSGASIC